MVLVDWTPIFGFLLGCGAALFLLGILIKEGFSAFLGAFIVILCAVVIKWLC